MQVHGPWGGNGVCSFSPLPSAPPKLKKIGPVLSACKRGSPPSSPLSSFWVSISYGSVVRMCTWVCLRVYMGVCARLCYVYLCRYVYVCGVCVCMAVVCMVVCVHTAVCGCSMSVCLGVCACTGVCACAWLCFVYVYIRVSMYVSMTVVCGCVHRCGGRWWHVCLHIWLGKCVCAHM